MSRDFEEDGCDYHPHCLTCPLVVCRHDAGGLGNAIRISRDAEIWDLHIAGQSLNNIASRFKLSDRHVQRVLATTYRATGARRTPATTGTLVPLPLPIAAVASSAISSAGD